jgi:signal transduction histidine kinase
VRIVNPAADRLFRGRPVRDIQDLLARFDPPPADLATGEQGVALRLSHQPGREFELRSFPIERSEGANSRPADDHRGRILTLRDVTASREERAERNAFLSILSHELRTPITTIYAGSRVLARRESRGAAAVRPTSRPTSAPKRLASMTLSRISSSSPGPNRGFSSCPRIPFTSSASPRA